MANSKENAEKSALPTHGRPTISTGKSFILRFGELNLKGRNQHLFRKRLLSNVKRALAGEPVDIHEAHHRIHVNLRSSTNEATIQGIQRILQRIFGFSSVSLATIFPGDQDEIESRVLQLARTFKERGESPTFRVTVQRLDKSFKMTSVDFERHLGALVVDETGWSVKLKGPDLNIRLEIMRDQGERRAALFTDRLDAAGGLPVGIEGRVLCLMGLPGASADRDILAAWLSLKRGASVTLGFLADDTSPPGAELSIPEELQQYTYGSTIKVITLAASTLASEIAQLPAGVHAVVIGAGIENYPSLPSNFPVFCPLVGQADEEVERQLGEIRARLH